MTYLFAASGVRARGSLHADVGREHLTLMKACIKHDWQIMAQTHSAASNPTAMLEAHAHAIIESAVTIVEQATGRRPKEWMAWHLTERPEEEHVA